MATSTGEWTLSEVVGGMVNPSFLALDRTGDCLYAVHGEPRDAITAFSIDRQSGGLRRLGDQPTETNPVHLAVDPSNSYIVVANGGANGGLALFRIQAEGALGPMCDLVHTYGKRGSGQVQKPKSHPHHCPLDRSGQFVVVPDRDLDKVFVYRIDAVTGRLVVNDPPYAVSHPGAGPRHVDFHPTGPWAYVVNETDSTVTTYHFDTRNGALTMLQTVPSLPPDFRGANTGAEIQVTPNGKFVYASNRGHDSLAIYAVDQSRGTLTPVGWEPTQGGKPRFFGIDPSGTFLYAANEDGHTIVTFRIDQESGKPSPTGHVVKTGSPVCIVFGSEYEERPA